MKRRLLGRIGSLGGLIAVCACVGLVGVPAAGATETNVECANITGSGSSLQNLAHKNVWESKWTSLWNLMPIVELKCTTMATVKYEPTSSGKGLDEWGAAGGVITPTLSFKGEKEKLLGLDAFVGTDVGPEGGPEKLTEGMVAPETQIALMDTAGGDSGGPVNKVITFPIAQSAISVVATAPEGCHVLALTGGDAKIVLKKLVSEWEKDSVPFEELYLTGSQGLLFSGPACKEVPRLEARESASGTTAGFKRYLDDLEPTYFDSCTLSAPNSESNTCWGANAAALMAEHKLVEDGNKSGGELAEKVLTLKGLAGNTEENELIQKLGAIGYVDLSDARNQHFEGSVGSIQKHNATELLSIIALVPNGTLEKEGKHFESPEASTEGSNCSGATYPEPKTVGPDVDWSRARESNATEDTSGVYPICTLTFDVMWQKYNLVKWLNDASPAGEEKYSEGEFHTAFNYLRWVITGQAGSEGGQTGTSATELEKAHFAPVTKKLYEEDEAGLTMTNVYWEAAGK